jgi:anti-sigma B factor antagonist
MQTVVEQAGDVTVVAVQAEDLDTSNADDLRQAMAPVLVNCRKLVLDLDRVRFMDSRGCGVIFVPEARREQRRRPQMCQGIRPRTFELIRLHRICEIHDTRTAAVQSFQPHGSTHPL